MKPLLLILDDWEGLLSISAAFQSLRTIAEVRFLAVPIAEALDSELQDVRFLMALRERTTLDEAVFKRLPNLQLILQTGGHAYHIDTAAARRRDIAIALGRRVKAPLLAVPELTIAMLLNLFHLLPQAQLAMRAGSWPLLTGRSLAGKRLGMLGMGRHGTRISHIAKNAFQMDVVAWDRTGNNLQTPDEVPRLSLEELLNTSDVVSIHLRLSTESTKLINGERLRQMKPGAFLINTSRGAIIDEPAMIDALLSGKLGGAGLDVFTEEPLPADSPLRSMENVLLTPHIGWTIKEVFEEFAQIACTQLNEYLEGTLSTSELYNA